MEPSYRTAAWSPAFYGSDPSFATGLRHIFFVVPEETEDFLISDTENATAVQAYLMAIDHPVYGSIEGVYNDGLDLHIFCSDGTKMIVNAEEDPGLLDESGTRLSDARFVLHLRNPIETGVTLRQYQGLFYQATSRLMRDFEEDRIRKALKIPNAEPGAAGQPATQSRQGKD